MKYKYPFIKPRFPAATEVIEDYGLIIESNWFTNFGPFEQRFCKAATSFIDESAHVTTIANATLALQAAIEILMTPSREKNQVITPSFTFASGPQSLLRSGLTPVFIDIDKSTWQPSLEQANKYMTTNSHKVAGILLGNTFGVGNLTIKDWEELADKYKLPLIIDSAAGFGSKYFKNEKLGMRGNCEIFSMHATKPFAVGEGGLIVSKHADFIKKIRSYQNFGFGEDKNIALIGTNAKLQELNCAIGLRQLKKFEDRLQNRRESLIYYKEKLSAHGFEFAVNDELSTVCFVSTLVPLRLDPKAIRSALNGASVESRQYYAPLHRQPLLKNKSITPFDLNNTETVYDRILSLPVYDYMEHNDLKYITDVIIGSVQGEQTKS